jgi:serine/threonine protein kinase
MAEEFPFRYIPPTDPNIGRRVDQYFILRTLLGRGGMGAAYLAEHEVMPHVKCVIKLVLADLANQPAVMSRWSTETSAVSVLKHDNIVRLHNFGTLEDGQPFMRFEHIEGRPLQKHVAAQGGRLSLRNATYIIIQVCDALDYAHGCGVVHRDLKPDNLMIELNPPGAQVAERVKVLDFGIAKVASAIEHTGAGVAMGTPGFMAPEQATNAATATEKADVFAVATVFYLAVTGMMPWGTPESDVAILLKQHTEPPMVPPISLMPPDVAKVVLRALALRPDGRPTMREFAQQLAAAIPGERHLPSGIEILREIKRSWSIFAPPNGRTLPRPVTDPDAGEPPDLPSGVESLMREDVVADNPAPAVPSEAVHDNEPANAEPHSDEPKRRASQSDLVITANVRRRPVAASLAAAERATFRPTSASGASDVGAKHGSPPPIIAALPTGLFSQRFAAQEAPSGLREESAIVAREFEMAIGTPSQLDVFPQLPAVVVSTTFLEGVSKPRAEVASGETGPASLASIPSDPHSESAARPERPPILVLPPALRRRSRRRFIAAGATACAVAAIASFAIARRSADDESSEAGSAKSSPEAAPVSAAQGSTRGRVNDATRGEEPRSPAALPSTGSQLTAAATGQLAQEQGAVQVPAASGAARRSVTPAANGVSPTSAAAHASNAVTAHPEAERMNPARTTGRPPSDPVARVTITAPAASISKPSTGNSSPSAADDREPLRGASTPVAAIPSASVPVSSSQANRKTGTLKVFVTPWAMVSLDGKSLDQTPVLDDVPAGRHRLRLVNKNVGKDETIVITVNAGQTTTIEKTW